jgi:elongation factor Ts
LPRHGGWGGYRGSVLVRGPASQSFQKGQMICLYHENTYDGTLYEGEPFGFTREFALHIGMQRVIEPDARADHLGRIAVLVALESKGDKAQLESLGKKVAMHIASANPLALSDTDVPAERIEREKSVLLEQIKEDPKAQGKPQQVLDKMLEGRMRKFFEESVLTKQAFVLNPDQTVEAAVKDAEKAAGAPIKITGFVRFAVGEGVEKRADNFAAEVAAMTKPT